jgi:hypothetical protein
MTRLEDAELHLRTTAIFSRRALALQPGSAPAPVLPARARFTLVVIGSAFDIDVFSFPPSWVWLRLHGSFHWSSIKSDCRLLLGHFAFAVSLITAAKAFRASGMVSAAMPMFATAPRMQ